jgi:hypothetical protein
MSKNLDDLRTITLSLKEAMVHLENVLDGLRPHPAVGPAVLDELEAVGRSIERTIEPLERIGKRG